MSRAGGTPVPPRSSRRIRRLLTAGLSAALTSAILTGAPVQAATPQPLIATTAAEPLPTLAVGEPDVLPETVTGRVATAAGRQPERAGGPDRYATAVAVSRRDFPAGAATVIVATGTQFADGVAAGPLAAALDAPLLLTPAAAAPPAVRAEVARLQPDRVIAIGGEGVVSAGCLADLAAVAGSAEVQRIAGRDRYATAAAIAQRIGPIDSAIIASGLSFPDALAAAPLATQRGGAVLLTNPAALPAATTTALKGLSAADVAIVGGTSRVSAAVSTQLKTLLGATPERIAGADRYATSALIADRLTPAPQPGALLATGDDFPDALAAAASGARQGRPVILLGGPYRFEVDAAVARQRGVEEWMQLSLAGLARADRVAPLKHTAMVNGHRATAIGRLYGWSHPEAVASLARMRATQKPDGGYGLDAAWDAFGDGTVNPVTTSYLVTVTDHVGRALLEGYRQGAVPASEVAELVDLVLAWPRIAGEPDCLAYSASPYDRTSCVHNVTAAAVWFVDAAYRIGAAPGPAPDLSAEVQHEVDAYFGNGWWPYRDAQTSRQDVNHNAGTIDPLRDVAPTTAQHALQRMADHPAVPYHPEAAKRTIYDPIGFLRLGDMDCSLADRAYPASTALVGTLPDATAATELADWSSRVAGRCPAPTATG